ncbi:MAG: hypothetical protein GY909_04990 [Oligoflexia bacterium]|nr:hypothetical protein [Oligoflexia bacterium]
MQILIVESDKQTRATLELNLRKEFDVNIHVKDDATDALGVLELFDDFIAVISLNKVGNEDTANKIKDSVREGVLFFIMGDTDIEPNPTTFLIDEYPDVKFIAKKIREKISADKKEVIKKVNDSISYKKLSLDILTYISTTPVDLYVKVKAQGKFQKYINRETEFEQMEVLKLEKLGHKYFYTTEDDFKVFLEYITLRLGQTFDTNDLNKATQKEITQKFFNYLSELEMKPAIAEMANKAVDSIFEDLDKQKDIKSLLNKIFKDNKDFKYQSSMMTSAIALSLVSKFTWSNEAIKKDLVLCSFLHDMSLTEPDHIRVLTEYDLNQIILSNEETEKIRHHAKLAAEVLEKSDKIPQSTINLIKHHHGNIGGVGFQQKDLSTAISQVDRLFMVSEAFSHQLLSCPSGKVNLKAMAKKVNELYPEKGFEEYVEKFLDCFKG